MNKYFSHRSFRLTTLFRILMFSLVVLNAVAAAKAQGQTSNSYTNPPLIGKFTPKQLVEQRTAYLRQSILPTRADVIQLINATKSTSAVPTAFARIADDAPAPGSASGVTSTEQTVDLTLGLYASGSPGEVAPWAIGLVGYGLPNAGLPLGPTPANTDVIWSHDESFLVFASNISGYYHLYAVAASGGPIAYNGTTPIYVEQLTGLTAATEDYDQRYPSLLGPSDSSIAYCSDDNANLRYQLVVAPFNNTGEGYTVNEANATAYAIGLQARHPFYTAGDIYFSGTPDASTSPWDIYTVATDSGLVTQLTGEATALPGYDNDNPNYSSGNSLVVWDTTATGFNWTDGGTPALTATGTTSPSYRNIYVAQASGAAAEPLTIAGAYDNEHPVWSTSNANDFTSGAGTQDIFFDSNRPPDFPSPTSSSGHQIWYYTAWSSAGLTTEAVGEAVQVDTSDTNDVSNGGAANQFNDTQPAVSSLVAPYVSVAYISNRYLLDTISDNPLALSSLDNQATQAAAIAQEGLDPGLDVEPGSYPTSAGGSEILVSRLLDVDPPALITYNNSNQEIVHVYPGDVGSYQSTTTTATHYVPAGQDATFVVRLSDRQTGVGAAWLQIKDPESATQDTTNLEHKVFTRAISAAFHDATDESTTLFDYGSAVYNPGGDLNAGYGGSAAIAGYHGNNQIILGNQEIYQNDAAVTTTGDTIVGTANYNAGTQTIDVSSLNGLANGECVILNYGDAPPFNNGDTEIVTITGTGNNPPSINVTATINGHAIGEPIAVLSDGGGATITTNIQNPPTYQIPINGNVQNNVQQFYVGDVIGIFPNTEAGDPTTLTPLETAQITSIPNNNTLVVDEAIVQNPATDINIEGIQGGYAKGAYVVERIGTAYFDPLGQEVDCQAIDTSLQANGGSPVQDQISAFGYNYYVPEYTPGIDDAAPFPGAPVDTAGNTYWLPLTPLPQADQDGNGGVLYYATWNTPLDVSDYYIDVIAEDCSHSQNWRIYDNVWGFTTQPFQAANSILVVNDYALPQKFFGRGGTTGSANGPEHIYGTESYWTDISTNVAGFQAAYATPYDDQTPQQQIADPPVTAPLIAQDLTPQNGGYALTQQAKVIFGITGGDRYPTTPYFPSYANGLGVNSYSDTEMSNVGTFTNADGTIAYPNSQKYDIWRILCRGPVPSTVLQSYGAQTKQMPPNPSAVPYVPAPVSTVVAPACVVWLTPYSGDVFAGPGTIIDGATQANLETFLNDGGRLHIEGKDIGYALTDNGAFPSVFYNQYLCGYPAAQAQTVQAFAADDVGNAESATTLTGAGTQADLISHEAYINSFFGGYGDGADVIHLNYWIPTNNTGGVTYSPPNAGPLTVAHYQIYLNSVTARTDASLDCYDPPFTYMDAFNIPTTGTTNNELFGSGGQDNREVFYENPTTHSIVSYSSFGMPVISQEVQNFGASKGNSYFVMNQRSNLIHNIVCTLRTSTITGILTSTGNGSQPVPGAVVWAVPTTNGGYNNPNNIYASAYTSGNGSYQIQGLPAGAYEVFAYKQGFAYEHVGTDIIIHGGDSGTFNVGITPEGPGNLTITVHDQNGNPIPNATVTATEIEGGTSPGSQQTSALGIATFTSVPSGTYTVNVTVFGYAPAASGGTTVTVNAAQTTAQTVVMTPVAATISGTVYQASSPTTVIPGATLILTDVLGTPLVPLQGNPALTATSAADGTYTINVPAGYYPAGVLPYVVGSAPAYVTSNPPITIGTVNAAQIYTNVGVPLVQQTGLQVTVLDALSNTPLPGITINTTGTAALTGTSNASGIVSFTAITPGTYTVTALQSSYQPAYVAQTVTPTPATVQFQTTTDVTVSLTPLVATMTVTVTNSQTSALLQGASVSIATATGTPITGTTNASGQAVFHNVRYGNYTVTVTDNRFVTGTSTVNVTTNGAAYPVAVALVPQVSVLSGTVTSSTTQLPLPNTTITINGTNYSTTTNASGQYSISNVQYGTYSVTAANVSYQSSTAPNVTIQAGANSQNFTLVPLPQAPAVTISPASGAYLNPIQVTMSDSLAGSTIYYTTDGTTPTTSSNVYTGPFTQAASATIEASAIEAAHGFSPETTVTYSIGQTAAAPTIAPAGQTFTAPLTVTITNNQPGSTVYYTTDGSTPTNASSVYSTPLTVGSTQTINAVSVESGYHNSPVASQTYISNIPTTTPTISPNSGQAGGSITVSIMDTQAGAVIYYTTDGTTPTTASHVYTAPFTIAATTGAVSETVNAIALAPGFAASATASASYTVLVQTVAPTINPNGGAVPDGQVVAITDTVPNVSIYYTTNGSAPTTSSSLYTSPLVVTGPETIQAIAVQTGYLPSTAASATFTLSSTSIASFGAGLQMISLPYTYAATGIDTVFGYANVVLAVWDPTSLVYDLTPTPPANAITAGQGYWVRFPAAVSVTTTGTPTPTGSDFVISLRAGWNMIGDPFTSAVPVSNLEFANETETDAQAISTSLIGPSIYGYDSQTNAYTIATTLNPDAGYWIYANSATTLDVPPPGN